MTNGSTDDYPSDAYPGTVTLIKAEGHEDVEEVGLTCNRMYTVCAECCRDDVYQTEDCANYHDHKPDEAHHCPTIRALDATPDTGGES